MPFNNRYFVVRKLTQIHDEVLHEIAPIQGNKYRKAIRERKDGIYLWIHDRPTTKLNLDHALDAAEYAPACFAPLQKKRPVAIVTYDKQTHMVWATVPKQKRSFAVCMPKKHSDWRKQVEEWAEINGYELDWSEFRGLE